MVKSKQEIPCYASLCTAFGPHSGSPGLCISMWIFFSFSLKKTKPNKQKHTLFLDSSPVCHRLRPYFLKGRCPGVSLATWLSPCWSPAPRLLHQCTALAWNTTKTKQSLPLSSLRGNAVPSRPEPAKPGKAAVFEMQTPLRALQPKQKWS